jgi:hypothetical protein
MNSLDNLLASHVLLPSQYYDSRRRTPTDNALHRLMLAVLADALECLSDRGAGGGRRREAREAARWVEDENDDYPFSFNSICDALGINAAQALRMALNSWLASGSRLARRTPVTRQTIKPQRPDGRRGRAGKHQTKNYLYSELADVALRRSDPSVAG